MPEEVAVWWRGGWDSMAAHPCCRSLSSFVIGVVVVRLSEDCLLSRLLSESDEAGICCRCWSNWPSFVRLSLRPRLRCLSAICSLSSSHSESKITRFIPSSHKLGSFFSKRSNACLQYKSWLYVSLWNWFDTIGSMWVSVEWLSVGDLAVDVNKGEEGYESAD